MTYRPARRNVRIMAHCMWVFLGCAAALLSSPGAVASAPPTPVHRPASCDQSRVERIPARTASAPSGSEFARRAETLSGTDRDRLVRAELLAGNIPQFLRRLVPVQIGDAAVELTVCVLPDYLAVGSNSDFVFVPMGLEAALDVARQFGFELPTTNLVDAIYQEAAVKLDPQPLPPGDAMRSTAYFVHHNELITEQRSALAAPLGELTSGHKKDLVLTSRLWTVPGRVAIYGWHRGSGEPIQPLSTVHGARYADYSHGVRFVSDTVYVDGMPRSLAAVFAEPALARLLTNEGPWTQFPERLLALMRQLAAERVKP